MKSTARREGDVYVLNGSKNWISYATVADHALVFAKTDPAAKHKGISAFVARSGHAGLHHSRHRAQARHLGGLDWRAVLRERRGAVREPPRRGRAGLRDRDVRARPGPVHRRGRRLRRHPRDARALRRVRARARDVRRGDRQVPVRAGHDRRDGARLRDVEAARDAGGMDEGRGARGTRARRRWRSGMRRSRRSARRISRSRSTAPTATRRSTGSSVTSATRAHRSSTRARRRSTR